MLGLGSSEILGRPVSEEGETSEPRAKKEAPELGLKQRQEISQDSPHSCRGGPPDDGRNEARRVLVVRRRLVWISVSEHLLDVPQGSWGEGGGRQGGGPGIAASTAPCCFPRHQVLITTPHTGWALADCLVRQYLER